MKDAQRTAVSSSAPHLGYLVGLLLAGALDHALPRRERLGLALATLFFPSVRMLAGMSSWKLGPRAFVPVLEGCDIGLASLVGDGVISAPLGRDPTEVTAGILSLSVVAHVV